MRIVAREKLKLFTIFVSALLLLPQLAWGHHFMEGGLPETFAQGFLSGLGHPVIGLDHAAFIVAAGFFLALVKGGMWGIVALIVGSLVGAALHLMGFDHERLTHRFQGRDYRLTDIHGKVVKDIIA